MGWGGVNSLHTGWYRAMFCINPENSVDNLEMFLSLLSNIAFLLFAATLARGLGVNGKLQGDRAGTGNSN